MITRRKPGKVRDSIIEYLSGALEDASVTEIHDAVISVLGKDVPTSSVRSYLRLNTPATFHRTGRGRYRLQDVADEMAKINRASQAPFFSHGRSKLYAGDCLNWLAAQRANSIHAVVTDQPYGLVEYSDEQQEKLRNGQGGVWRIPPSFDGHKRSPLPRFTTLGSRDMENLASFFFTWAKLSIRVVVPGANVIVASNPLLSYAVAGAIVRAGFERRGEIVRLVRTMRGGDRPKNAHKEFPEVSVMARSMWEPWLVFRKPIEGRVQDNLRQWKTGGLRRPSRDKPFGDVVSSFPARRKEKEIAPHPSLKPQAFLRQVVRAVLPLGEGIVLDPFAGSGSTLAAAEAVNYDSVGVERDLHFLGLARQAIPKLATLSLRPR